MVAVGKLLCFRCWSVRTRATCRQVVLKRPLGGTLLLEQWINFSPHETCSTVRFSSACIWSDGMCVCPRRSTVQMWRGGKRERGKNRCAVPWWRPPFSLIGLRQVAAHVKPLRADSNDTGQELLAWVTQRCACVCVCVCVCASASV